MTFGSEHVQTAKIADLVALGTALDLEVAQQLLVASLSGSSFGLELFWHQFDWQRKREVIDENRGVDTLFEYFVLCKTFGVTAQQNVNTATGHVGSHRDAAQTTRLGDDHRFTAVLLGVEDLVGDAALGKHLRQKFALGNADGADQDRLATTVLLGNIVDDGTKLGNLGLVNEVSLVGTRRGFVGRNRNNRKIVCAHQFGGFGLRGTGHAGQLVVHAEVVLQRDGGKRLVFFFDLDALFGLDRLVDALAPAPTFKNATGEFVDNFDLAIGDDVVLVTLVQLFRLEGD